MSNSVSFELNGLDSGSSVSKQWEFYGLFCLHVSWLHQKTFFLFLQFKLKHLEKKVFAMLLFF